MIYRDILNYTSIIIKNKTKDYLKKTKNIFNKTDNNTIFDSNNINDENSNNLNNNYINYKNSNEIYSSNELSFLIFSSNKETNKFKRDVLFGNILSLSKDKDKLRFNSLMKDSNKKSNSFKNSNVYKYLENNIKNKGNDNLNYYLTSEKNKIKTNDSFNSLRNQIFNTAIKRDYSNLFDNENNFSLNDYLNLYQNDENINNDILNDGSPQDNYYPDNNITDMNKNFSEIKKSPLSNTNINNDKKNLEIIEEKEKIKKKNRIILNEELFNTRIKEKISKIKEDIIVDNNIKSKKEDKKNIKNKKYLNSKLRIDKFTDYYEYMSNKLEKRDESKILENIFSEFFSEIRFKYWMKDSFNNFIYSLNNCKIYDLIKLRKKNNDSNYFDTLISNMELSNNKNLSNTNSSLYNSKSELLRNGSHSINDSQSSQTIENQPEKNVPLISKFPKLMIPQSIIPEESSNFLYSNNDYILNRSLGEPIYDNNINNNLMEVEECDEGKDFLYEENIINILNNIEKNNEININNIFEKLKLDNIFEEKQFENENIIKEYKANIFYEILLIAQNKDMNFCQKNIFGKIIKMK